MNVFFYSVWGRTFIKNFLNYSLNCLNENIKLISKKKLNSSKIEIWTRKSDENLIAKSSLFKQLEKKISINFVHIDKLLLIKEISKYERLAIMQNIFVTSHFFKYKYLWFFYPDSIFDNKLVLNCLTQIKKKNPDIVLLPVPQVDEKSVKNEFKKKNISELDIKKLIRNNLHESVKLWEVSELKNFNIPLLYGRYEDTLVFQNFHIHPLVLKTTGNHMAFTNPLHPSLDEGIPEEFANKRIFIPPNDKFGICGGLLETDFLNKTKWHKNYNKWKNIKNKMSISISFAINHINSSHIKFSQKKYFMNKKSDKGINKKKLKLDNLVKKIRYGYHKHYSTKSSLKKFAVNTDLYINNIPSTLLLNEKLRKKFQNLSIIQLNFDLFRKILKNNDRIKFKVTHKETLKKFLGLGKKSDKETQFYKNFLNNLYKQNINQ